jgi:hypothetical protein
MLHDAAAQVTVDVRRGLLAIVLVATMAVSPGTERYRRPVPGATCLNSPASLQNNLPLSGGGTYQTDIVDIVGFASPGEHRVSGWIFTNRIGQLFFSVRKNAYHSAAQALTLADAFEAAATAREPYSTGFTQIDPREAAGLISRLTQRARVFRCFQHPLR